MKLKKLTPARLIALSFFAVIAVGAGLLMLPVASKGAPAAPLDALFTATSATCVTGLIVRDTFTGWTLFGQLVILALIQLGGLGFMTVITLVSFAIGKRLSLYDRKVLMQSAGNATLNGVGGLIRHIVPFTFVFELTGAAVLATRFVPDFGWGRGLYAAVFHSVSAFCNAGFDLMGMRAPFSSLTSYVSDPVVNLTVCVLVVIGGLGFLVWRDIVRCRFRFGQFQLHTKLVLTASGVLLLLGWALFLLFERNASMAGLTWPQKVLASLFQSVSPRTAGFNTVELSSLSESGSLLTDVLMLIGGSPGSTAGGIKTTSVAVVLVFLFSGIRGRRGAYVFGRRIPDDAMKRTGMIVSTNLILALCGALVLCGTQSLPLSDVLIETFSAIGTVGMSTGITRELTNFSALIVALLMYCGRVGSVSFAMALLERRSDPPVTYPTEQVTVG